VSSKQKSPASYEHAIEQLREPERKSRAWLEQSPVCTKIVSLDFNLEYMSSAGVKALQIEDITVHYGKPYPFEFYPESFKNQMAESLEEVKRTGQTATLEAAVVDISGNELWFHSTLVPVNDENGQLDYIIVVSIDTTERNKIENELTLLNKELEQRVISRTQELNDANELLKVLSETDALTKIANRRMYEIRITHNIATAIRTKQYLTLLIVDVDYFKKYNDNYGHAAGDIILKKVAETIDKSLPRATDLVARIGGEEFGILLPATGTSGGFEVAENIRKNIEKLAITHGYSGASGVVTVSIGLSSLKADELEKERLFREADSALYTAKETGRNRCQVFDK